MADAVSTSDGGGGLSLLDIVDTESAVALKDMIDNSPGHTYIKPDLSDVNLLKVSIIDGNDDSVVSQMEMVTNAHAAVYQKALTANPQILTDHQTNPPRPTSINISISNSIKPTTMDPNLVAQLLANDPNTTTTQPNNPVPQSQNNTALQSPPPAPSSPAPTTNNQLAPPRENKYTNTFNPNPNNQNSLNPFSGPRYYPDSDSDYESDGDDQSPFSSLGISINSGNNYGNNYGPVNDGIVLGNGGWPNGGMMVINGQDWSRVPQSQWPASVRRDYQRGMAQGARGMAEGARAMSEAADLLNGLGLGMGMGMGLGRSRRRR